MNAIHSNTQVLSWQVAQPAVTKVAVVVEDAASLAETAGRVHSIAQAFFAKLAEVVRYIAGLVPLVMAVYSSIALVKDAIAVHKARLMGLGRDLVRAIWTMLRNLLNVIRNLIKTIPLLAQIFEVFTKISAIISSIAAAVLGVIVYLLHAIKEIYFLVRTYQMTRVIDKILNDSSLSPEAQFERIIQYVKKKFDRRVEQNAESVRALPEGRREAVAAFLSVQAQEELKEVFGEMAYYRLDEVIKNTDASGKLDFSAHPEAIVAIREARSAMQSKIVRHWLDIVADVVSIASAILSVACPAVGAAMIVGYVLLGSFATLAITNLTTMLVEQRALKRERSFCNCVVEANKVVLDMVRNNRPAKSLFQLDKKDFRSIRAQVVQKLLGDMRLVLLVRTKMSIQEIDQKLSGIGTVSGLKKAWKRCAKQLSQNTTSLVTWKFLEKMRVLETASNYFLARGLGVSAL